MRKEVPVWVALVVIVAVIGIVGVVYWQFSRPRSAPYINPQQAIHQAPKMPSGVLGPGSYPGKGPYSNAPGGQGGMGVHGSGAPQKAAPQESH